MRPRAPAHAPSRLLGLDGVRALAVLAIMGFHFGLGWLQGGFFGVDVFYVLSGFLITGLLLREGRLRGTIGLSAFWLRRARRLLPCLALVLVAVALCVRYLAPPDTYPGFRMDALSAAFYFSNWWQIHTASNYFVATGAVSPLTHTWSLAIEEQFYLVWPLVTLAILRLSRSYERAVRVLLGVAVVGAIASAVEMAVLYSPGVETRLYFGTDTHAQCILIGAALACVMALRGLRDSSGRLVLPVASTAARRLLTVAGVLGLGALAVLSVAANGSSAFTYQGGFALCALASAAVITAATCVPSGPMDRVLSLRPLVWLGTISYGVYLWHFPIDIFVTPARVGVSGWPLMGIQFALTMAVSAASFVLIERPIMTGTFWRSARALLPSAVGAVATVAIIVVATAAPAVATAPTRRYVDQVHDTPPKKVAVLGDSLAGTLQEAVAATAPAGVTVIQGAIVGCGLAIAANSSNQMGQLDQVMYAGCNEADPPSQRWPARDAANLRGVGTGDVVVFLAGVWETQDLLMHGRWTNILHPSFRRYELRQLRTLVAVATAHGAHLDLLTMPAVEAHGLYDNTDTRDAGPPNPASSPRRRALYNGLLRQTAAAYPGKVSVLDYGTTLSPKGTFTEYLDGVQVRTTDGVHTPSYAPSNSYWDNSPQPVAQAFYQWLSPRLWPAIIASAQARPSPGSQPGSDVQLSSGRS